MLDCTLTVLKVLLHSAFETNYGAVSSTDKIDCFIFMFIPCILINVNYIPTYVQISKS
jgi:hypothetical protein